MAISHVAIAGGDASTLLPAMLQGIQAKKGQPGYLSPRRNYPHYATFIVYLIVFK
jgi:hypothetical protein